MLRKLSDLILVAVAPEQHLQLLDIAVHQSIRIDTPHHVLHIHAGRNQTVDAGQVAHHIGQHLAGLFPDGAQVVVLDNPSELVGTEPNGGSDHLLLQFANGRPHPILCPRLGRRIDGELQETVLHPVTVFRGVGHGHLHLGRQAERLHRILSGHLPRSFVDPVGHRVPLPEPPDHRQVFFFDFLCLRRHDDFLRSRLPLPDARRSRKRRQRQQHAAQHQARHNSLQYCLIFW